ncbi:MAG: ArsR family transcriptional regulator [Alphaproteobacteria bacterium]|nr:ArsR family transcriptional regulator [Alphaproteobacteria bacterium]
MLDSLITSKTRVKLLIKFFANEGNQGYLRGLAEEFNESTNSVRVELNRLSKAGLLVSQPDGKTKSYQANRKHPLFGEIRSIVAKYLGFDRLVEVVIHNLGNVKKAIILGDYAQGIDSGTIELLLIGKDINFEYLAFLVQKAEEKIDRKVIVEVLESEPVPSPKGLVVFDI